MAAPTAMVEDSTLLEGGNLIDADGGSDDGDWEDWAEPEAEPTTCLFSAQVFGSAAECLAHAATHYGLDLVSISSRHRLDIYGRVKLVNYVRTLVQTAEPSAVVKTVNDAAAENGGRSTRPWDDDAYLRPVLADDPLLYSLSAPPSSADKVVGDDDGDQIWADSSTQDAAGEDSSLTNNTLLLQTVAQMREEMVSLLGLDEDGGAAASPSAPHSPHPLKATPTSPEAGVGHTPTEGEYGSKASANTDYFASYAKLSIHEEMLNDHVRTQGYRDALEKNAHLFKGKVVLDVGCGTAILAMFAARAGAARVIAIDASDIIETARVIVTRNHLEDRITLVRGTLETLRLPDGIEKVDLIVSEWMGYALLYESMLPTVLYARDRLLAPGGLVLPTACKLCIGACSHDRLGFWADVYGFDMGNISEALVKEASVEVVPPSSLLSESHAFHTIDVTCIDDAALDFEAAFTLRANSVGEMRCFVLHFDTVFDCTAAGGVCTAFTTSAAATPTHWKQTALHLKEAIPLAVGDVVTGTVRFSRGLEYKRGYDISVDYALNGEHRGLQMWKLE